MSLGNVARNTVESQAQELPSIQLAPKNIETRRLDTQRACSQAYFPSR